MGADVRVPFKFSHMAINSEAQPYRGGGRLPTSLDYAISFLGKRQATDLWTISCPGLQATQIMPHGYHYSPMPCGIFGKDPICSSHRALQHHTKAFTIHQSLGHSPFNIWLPLSSQLDWHGHKQLAWQCMHQIIFRQPHWIHPNQAPPGAPTLLGQLSWYTYSLQCKWDIRGPQSSLLHWYLSIGVINNHAWYTQGSPRKHVIDGQRPSSSKYGIQPGIWPPTRTWKVVLQGLACPQSRGLIAIHFPHTDSLSVNGPCPHCLWTDFHVTYPNMIPQKWKWQFVRLIKVQNLTKSFHPVVQPTWKWDDNKPSGID